MKDIVIGCITNYDWDKIKFWVNSLEKSGFDGLKIMICYNISYDVAEKLTEKGFTIFGFKKNDELRRLEYPKENFNICVERFLHIAYFLSRLPDKHQYRYVISTDVKDVIFQTHPGEWLKHWANGKKLNVACESIRYKDEPWGKNNMFLSFGPLMYEQMQDKLIFNAGTISGEFDTFVDFCKNIYLVSVGAPAHVPGGGGPDQAAMNILLNMKPYSDITNFAMSEDGYAAQLGTTVDPNKITEFQPLLVEKSPILVEGTVCTSMGSPFSIVHQYDRVPEWKKMIEEKYS